MKNCLRRARRAVDRDCDTERCAASAKEKAIACLSTDVRPRRNSKVRSDGTARAQRSALGIPAEFLAAFHRRAVVHSLNHLLPLRSLLLRHDFA
jgi:hypothetical protein